MPDDFTAAFAALKPVLAKYAKRLSVKAETEREYTLLTKAPSPFPQHKGHPMYFGSVRLGKAYVSFHLMPLYMCPALTSTVPPGLKRRMQGKTCFNFKTVPEPETLAELKELVSAAFKQWQDKKWV
ncbi:MAG TPA: hypothetical protein VN924_28325 [Bryobacteraceae bacterium]|jgi:hypothetical protein|nr:hypothetical protein [Bryobacteraceae bacterium]